MRAIDLNFAHAPFRNKTPYYLGYGLGTLLIAGFTAYNGWAYFAYAESRAGLESEHASRKARLETLNRQSTELQEKIKKQNIESLNKQAGFTNALLERRRFSWTELLNNLEEVQPYQVRMLSLIPRIQDKQILIQARAVARDLRAYANFQQNLLNHPKFRRVYPSGWLRPSDTGEYLFNIGFNYFPDGAPADVKGLRPEELIVEAPGSNPSPVDESEDGEGTQEAPAPPSASGPGSKGAAQSPASAGAGSAGAGLPGAVRPPGTGVRSAAGVSGRPPAGGTGGPAGAPAAQAQAPPQPAPPPQPGVVDPGVTGPAASADPPAAGPVRPRFPGRGPRPGSDGSRPPAPGKPPGVKTIPLPSGGSEGGDGTNGDPGRE